MNRDSVLVGLKPWCSPLRYEILVRVKADSGCHWICYYDKTNRISGKKPNTCADIICYIINVERNSPRLDPRGTPAKK